MWGKPCGLPRLFPMIPHGPAHKIPGLGLRRQGKLNDLPGNAQCLHSFARFSRTKGWAVKGTMPPGDISSNGSPATKRFLSISRAGWSGVAPSTTWAMNSRSWWKPSAPPGACGAPSKKPVSLSRWLAQVSSNSSSGRACRKASSLWDSKSSARRYAPVTTAT